MSLFSEKQLRLTASVFLFSLTQDNCVFYSKQKTTSDLDIWRIIRWQYFSKTQGNKTRNCWNMWHWS